MDETIQRLVRDRLDDYDATRAGHAIAAASIVAKVHRDAMMLEFDAIYPQYGLARHKGYSCPEHYRALREHGASPLHRRSFEPVYRLDQFELSLGMPEFS